MSYRAGFVGVLGLPNAGKSTLVNALVGERVSIVTDKPQTTRKRCTGIYTDDESQIIFHDAPGKTTASGAINEFIREEYKNIIEGADVLMLLLDLTLPIEKLDLRLIEDVQEAKKPWIIVLNKTDQVKEEVIIAAKESLSIYSRPILLISALEKEASFKPDLVKQLQELLPESDGPLYDEDLYTTENIRDLVAEVVRESCFESLHHEIPYGLAIRVTKFDEETNPKVTRIFAEILVNKPSHRPIVIGNKGTQLRDIGQKSRINIEKMLQKKVYLNLHVKIRNQWMKSKTIMKELGYV